MYYKRLFLIGAQQVDGDGMVNYHTTKMVTFMVGYPDIISDDLSFTAIK